ncbi:MAG: flavin reductase family protein [Planctomycetota bacterium]
MQKILPDLDARDVWCPRELVVAIARDAAGKPNPIALGFAMSTSIEPPMLAVSLVPTHHTAGAIRRAREFVVALPAEDQGDETMLYGTKSGRDVDKLALTGAATQPAAEIDCVLLADAVANFECRLAGEMETGDHVLFVGQVVAAHVSQTPKRRLYILGPGHKLGGLPRVSAQ